MSMLAALSASLTGLDAAKRSIQLAANNVANAHTEGYARKTVEQKAIVVNGLGMGVDASEVRRVADDFLAAELRTQRSALASLQTVADIRDRLQVSLFGRPGEAGMAVAPRMAELAAALETFANQPEKLATRTGVLGALEDLADSIAHAGRTIQQMRKDSDERIAELVRTANEELQALHELNIEFARGQPTTELLDERVRLLDSLSDKIEITVADLDRGTIAIYARGGVPLLEYGAKQIIYSPAASMAEDTVFSPIEVYDDTQLDPTTGDPLPGEVGMTLVTGGTSPTTTLQTGRLAGLLEARDDILPTLADQYDELAELARFALNAAHNEAWPSPPPASVTGTRVASATDFDAATRSGTAYLAIVDRTTGTVVDTVSIDLTQTAATLVSNLNTAISAYGSAGFDSDGALTISLSSPYGLAMAAGDGVVTETDADGRTRDYGFSHFFGLNDILVRTPTKATDLSLAPAVASDPTRLGNARLDVDTAAAPPTSTFGGKGDNRGALALGDALATSYDTLGHGQLAARAVDMQTYAADIASVQAQEAASAERLARNRGVLVDDLETRRASISGVSLDEELSRLMVYQQAYAASARIMGAVDEMLRELLDSIR